MKLYCRRYGVMRWPYRKLASIDSLIEVVTAEADDNPAIAAVSSSCRLPLSPRLHPSSHLLR
eukprot:231978-Chlamydomonas_euryale.AAC.1